MYWLSGGPFRTEAKLSRTYSTIEKMGEALLYERGVDRIHSVSEGDRTIVGEFSGILLELLNEHNDLGKSPGIRRSRSGQTIIEMV